VLFAGCVTCAMLEIKRRPARLICVERRK